MPGLLWYHLSMDLFGDSALPDRRCLLVSDLDGTLAVRGRIGHDDRREASRLRAAGIPILVITGRNLRSLGRTAEVWEVADTVMFSSGSGLMAAPDAEPVERHRLNADDIRRLTGILDGYGEDYCLLDPVPHTHQFAWRRHRPVGSNPDFDARMAIYEEWARDWNHMDPAASDGACQVLVIRPPGMLLDPDMERQLRGWSVFHSSSPLDHASMWLEVFPAGMDKGSALADWCREHGIPASRVMALGNDFNDRSMLEWSGYPRVVANAPKELRLRFRTLPAAGQGGFAAAAREALELFS